MGKWSEPRPGKVYQSHEGAKWVGASETSGEVREPEEWWCSVSGSLRVSSWEDEIQLNRVLPALFGEMWESQVRWWALKYPRIKVSWEFGRSSGKRCKVENRVECFWWGGGGDIEKEKRGTLLEVDFDAEIVWGLFRECEGSAWKKRSSELIRVRTPLPFWFPAVAGPRRVRVRSARKTE